MDDRLLGSAVRLHTSLVFVLPVRCHFFACRVIHAVAAREIPFVPPFAIAIDGCRWTCSTLTFVECVSLSRDRQEKKNERGKNSVIFLLLLLLAAARILLRTTPTLSIINHLTDEFSSAAKQVGVDFSSENEENEEGLYQQALLQGPAERTHRQPHCHQNTKPHLTSPGSMGVACFI